MRPDIIMERVAGLYFFTGESARGREWLERRSAQAIYERIGKSIAVDDEKLARDQADAATADGWMWLSDRPWRFALGARPSAPRRSRHYEEQLLLYPPHGPCPATTL